MREEKWLVLGLLIQYSSQHQLPLHSAEMNFSIWALHLTQRSKPVSSGNTPGTECQTSTKVNIPERELRK